MRPAVRETLGLIRLYRESGKFLHRGTLKDVLAHTRPKSDLARIKDWAFQIWTPLEHHQIQLFDPDLQIVGLMKDKVTARAQFAFWVRESPKLFRVSDAVRAD